MKIITTPDYHTMSNEAAHIIAAQVEAHRGSVLGLATGSTPVGLYARLAEKRLDFSEVRTVNLDEYAGLDSSNPCSYKWFMQENLFSKVNLRSENTHLPNGMASDPEAECARYEELINSLGGIDLQLLGIGHDGHIGFNEPSRTFAGITHLETLAEETIEANKRFFTSAAEVPRRAFTMGIGTIMRARRILVVVSGADKAAIVRRAFAGPVTPEVPASILQFHHNVTLVGDAAAFSQLVRE